MALSVGAFGSGSQAGGGTNQNPTSPTVTVTPEEATHPYAENLIVTATVKGGSVIADRQCGALQRKFHLPAGEAGLWLRDISTFSPARWQRAPIRSLSPIRPTPSSSSSYAASTGTANITITSPGSAKC
jgi:hypothetical protein